MIAIPEVLAGPVEYIGSEGHQNVCGSGGPHHFLADILINKRHGSGILQQTIWPLRETITAARIMGNHNYLLQYTKL